MCVWWECSGLHLPPLLYMCMSTRPLYYSTPQPSNHKAERAGEWWVGCHCSWHPPTSRHGPSAIWGWCTEEKKYRNTEVQIIMNQRIQIQKVCVITGRSTEGLNWSAETIGCSHVHGQRQASQLLHSHRTFSIENKLHSLSIHLHLHLHIIGLAVYQRVVGIENKLQVFGWLIKGVVQLGDRTMVSNLFVWFRKKYNHEEKNTKNTETKYKEDW